ncbi:MAG: NAD(P)H-dependent oxidoreductase [Candidatus Pacebacteria bacterium]|nr:NAD(P)H-dependent oxidoreductase [Candidatus Paceibacterota bacterium]
MKEKILCLLASPNKEGNSATLAKWFLEDLDKEKYELETVFLYDYRLDYTENSNYNFGNENKEQEDQAEELFRKITSANKIVLATPIWNFGVPAVLKNLLDRASAWGRIWSEKKRKKVPNWKGKRFYLFFSTGAPRVALSLNFIAILQLFFTLSYYGAKRRNIALACNCGNGSKNVVENRAFLKRRIKHKARRIFK